MAAQFFLSLDAKEAYDYLKEVNTRYIVIDYSTAIDKFYALPAQTRTGAKIDSFFGVFNVLQKNNTMTVNPFFYPAYYQSMIARLYNFGGQKVESPGTIAIQYDKNSRVTSLNDFATLKEAEDYVQTHEGSFAVGGTDPFISPINLEPLDSYKLVFESKQRIGGQAEVKIFEVLN